ncbi:MAG: ABC transporter permease [Bacteriovoracaceae bacterium]
MIFKFFLWKEFKKFPFFFFLLGFTLFLGTSGLMGIKLITQEVKEKLDENSKQLLTSDFVVSSRRDLKASEKEIIDQIVSAHENKTYKVIDLYSMVTQVKDGQSRLADIIGIESGYPFYGKVTLKEGSFREGMYVSKDLADLWNIKIGDELQIGSQKFKVDDIILHDTSEGLRGFSLAPRIYLPLAKLSQTGLIRPGSTGQFSYHYLFPKTKDLTSLKKSIYKKIKDTAVKVYMPEDSSEQTGRVIKLISNFMSLSALIGLVLSLVGVFYLYQSHLIARLKDLCLIHLFGKQKIEIALGIVLQFSLVFILVVLSQLILIAPAHQTLSKVISPYIGLELSPSINYASILKEIPLLYLLAISVLIPLLMGIMRTSMGVQLKSAKLSMGKFRFFDFSPFCLILWGLSCYLGQSFKIGNIFFGSLAIIFCVSSCFILILQWFLKKWLSHRDLRNPNVELGVALRGLLRSGHRLTLSFLSLALGTTLITLILQLDHNIQNELKTGENRPGLFLFDIQEEQVEDLIQFAKAQETPIESVTPMIRARLEKINDEKFIKPKSSVSMNTREDEEENRMRNTGLNLTYRNFLSPAEKIIEGKPFPKQYDEGRLPFVSLEKRWAERMKVEIGDKLTFDVQGVEIEGRVINLREVKWTSFYPNFFVTLEPGVLDGAPKTYLAVLPAKFSSHKKVFQRQAVAAFPNISFIDVEEMIQKLSGLFEKSRKAIELISWLSLLIGLVILYGLSHDQVYRRFYDLALMKVLGLSAGRLRLNLLFEFGLLFILAISMGAFLGWIMAQVIGKEVFKLGIGFDLIRMLAPVCLLVVLCLTTIFVSSWRAVKARPRELLSDI